MQGKTDLSKFNNRWFEPGAPFFVRVAWFFVNRIFFISYFPFNLPKILLLRMFGAKVGEGVIIKPHINIKYPWKLRVGDHCWIGEGVWIDNLDEVSIGSNSCISQGALLLCGNHNYKKTTFDLMLGRIILEEGVWIGAKAVVCGGVTCKSHALLTVGSVAVSDLDAYSVYQGNPAMKVRERKIAQ